MPFQSEKQRRYLHANHPDIANKWEKKYGLGGIAGFMTGGRIGFNSGSNGITLGSDKYNITFEPGASGSWTETDLGEGYNIKDKNISYGVDTTTNIGPVEIGVDFKNFLDKVDVTKDGTTVMKDTQKDKQIAYMLGVDLDTLYGKIESDEEFKNFYVTIRRTFSGGGTPAHQAGVLGLAEGGKIIDGQPHQLSYITPSEAQTLQHLGGRKVMTPEGIPAYPPWDDVGASPGTSHTANQGSNTGGGHDYEGEAYGTPDSIASLTSSPTPDDSQDDDKAESYVNWNIQEKYKGTEDLEEQLEIDKRNALTKLKYDPNLTKKERHSLEVGLGFRKPKQNTLMGNILKGIVAVATGGAGAGLFGKDIMKVAKLYQNFKTAKNVKTAWDNEKIKLGKMEFDISNLKNKLTSDNQKLLASLPDDHPEKIELLAKMKIKTPGDDGPNGDGASIKIEDIETVNKTKAQTAKEEEYLKMQQASYLWYLEQQKKRQAYLDNYKQKYFLANKGGLAGLFRVKNS